MVKFPDNYSKMLSYASFSGTFLFLWTGLNNISCPITIYPESYTKMVI